MNSQILNLLSQRRSIRKFKPTKIEPFKLEMLLEAAVRTRTSRGRNPWEFIVVQDESLIHELSTAKEHGSAFLSSTPLAIVVAADAEKSDVWTEDCSIAAFVLQLMAQELGLGSCWAQIRLREHKSGSTAEDYVKSLLGLPSHYAVECIVGIGYPAEDKPGHAFENLPFDHIHRNIFSDEKR